MLLGARTAAWYGDLPAGCRHVKYLESNGKQYIDLLDNGFVFGDFISVTIANTIDSTGYINNENKGLGSGIDLAHNVTFGLRRDTDDGNWIAPYINYRNLRYTNEYKDSDIAKYAWFTETISLQSTLTATLTRHSDGKVLTGTRSGFSSTFYTGNSTYLFKDHTDAYPFPGLKRISGFYNLRSGERIVDVIPIAYRSGSTSVGCMYDKARKMLFFNLGTGAFGWEEMDGTIVSPT